MKRQTAAWSLQSGWTASSVEISRENARDPLRSSWRSISEVYLHTTTLNTSTQESALLLQHTYCKLLFTLIYKHGFEQKKLGHTFDFMCDNKLHNIYDNKY